jgi:hypothetical protein
MARTPSIIGGRTPLIRCFCNNYLSILACIGKVFACCLHQEHNRLPVVHNLSHSLCSELHLGTLLLLTPCHTCAASRRSSTLMYGYISGKCGETRNSLSLSGKKMEWESPPSIMVTRNPNWSQRSGTKTGCVKGRY